MASLPALALAPARLALRFLDDVTRVAEGAAAVGAFARELTPRAGEIADNIARIADGVESVHETMKPLDAHVDGLQGSFDRSNEELRQIREAFTPHLAEIGDDIGEVRDAAEPLQGAAQRVGRAVERLPGPGRRR